MVWGSGEIGLEQVRWDTIGETGLMRRGNKSGRVWVGTGEVWVGQVRFG